MKKDILIYENFLPQKYFDILNELVISQTDMPWFFLESVSGENDYLYGIDLQYGFSHLIYDGIPNSPLFNEFYKILEIMQNQYNIEVFNLKRMRLGMQTKVSEKSIVNFPHTDYPNPHTVLLIYLNDSDGNTIFYDENEKIVKIIEPKPNRAVLFDGNILHSSSTPTKNSRRIALNINFNFYD